MFAVAITIAAACTEKAKEEPVAPVNPFTVTGIITDPKAPAAGDTVKLTVIIEGNPSPGTFPQITWNVSDGAILDSGEQTARWATGAPGIVNVSVSVSNSVDNGSASLQIFVTPPPQPALASNVGEFHFDTSGPAPVGWTLREKEENFVFLKLPTVYLYPYDNGLGPVFPSPAGAYLSDIPRKSVFCHGYTFSKDLSRSAFMTVEISPSYPTEWYNIGINDHNMGTYELITTDKADVSSVRRHWYQYPNFSPNGDELTFQAFKPAPQVGQVDTFDVYVYDIGSGVTTNTTATHGEFRYNFRPSFSSDGNWLTFISSRTGTNKWELYGLPITGGVIDTDSSATTRLTDTGGLIGAGQPLLFTPPTMLWNPIAAIPTCAIVGADGTLRMVTTDAGGATSVNVTAITQAIRQMVWSADGTTLLVTTAKRLYLVTPAGTATQIASSPDEMWDVAISADNEWVTYRRTRGANSWMELLDVDQGIYEAPLPLTKTQPFDKIVSLRNFMGTLPLFTDTGLIYYLEQTGSSDPQIRVTDVSSLVLAP